MLWYTGSTMNGICMKAIYIDYAGNEVEVTVLEMDGDLYRIEFEDGSCDWVYRWCVSLITTY